MDFLDLEGFFCWALLKIEQGLCYIIHLLYSMFEVFAGLTKVSFEDADGNVNMDYLINIFFFDKSINTIYWGMATIGIVLSFGFAMYALVKKIFDIDDKIKTSIGGILANLLKGILSIFILNFMVVAILAASNTLMQQMIYLFDNTDLITNGNQIAFDNSDYATMARIYNTIGNYSLNPSRNSKYNVNACFNEIREDMQILQKKNVFNFTYQDFDKVKKEGSDEYDIVYKKTKATWQSDLVNIAMAHSLSDPQPIDEYNEKLTKAIVNCMNDIDTYRDFAPIKEYKSPAEAIGPSDTPIDVLIFLSGTLEAAREPSFNQNASMFDSLRYEYVRKGGKDIYDTDQVEEDFDIHFEYFNHITVICVAIILAKIFLALCVNCVARIFNMLLLYIIAPPFIAVTPLDDGEKTKQWWTAFIIQAFSVFGSVVGIRLLMLFIPQIFNSGLVLFSNSYMNYLAKIVMLVAISVTVEQASKLITGILANNAGMQSLYAADVGGQGAQRLMGMAQKAGSMAFGAAKGTLSGAASVFGVKNLANRAASAIKNSNGGRKLQRYLGVGEGSFKSLDDKANKIREEDEAHKRSKDRAKADAEEEKKEKGGDARKRSNSLPNAVKRPDINSYGSKKKK